MAITNTLRVIKFWTAFKPGPDGNLRGIDMVRYGHIGKDSMSCMEDAVHRLSNLQPFIPSSDNNEAIEAAHMRWSIIGPAYAAWKDGHELPTEGTPIAAWPGISPEQAEALRSMGLKTIEQFAHAGDDLRKRIPIPNVLELQKQANLFLAASDKVQVTTELKKRDELIEAQALQLEEMRQIVLELQAKSNAAEAEGDKPAKAAKVKAA